MKALSFEEAEKLARGRRELADRAKFRKVCLQQGVGNALPRDLPFVNDCCQLGSAETKAAIDNLGNILRVEDAKRLSNLFLHLHFDELDALLKKEVPKLHFDLQGRLTYAALHTFIEFRAGKKIESNQVVMEDERANK